MTRNARLLLLGTAVLVAIAVAPVGVGLASALVLYELFARPYSRLVRRMPPGLAAAIIIGIVLVAIVGPLTWLGFHVSKRLPAVLSTIHTFRAQHADTAATGIAGQLESRAAGAAASVSDWAPGVFNSLARNAAWALLNWSVALFGLYYLLGEASGMWPKFARLLPMSHEGTETLRTRFRDITQGMVAGTLLSAAIQGAAIGTGFLIAGLPDPLFWGACAAITTLVPVVGNAIVSVPALLLLILRQNYGGAIAMAVFSGALPPIIDRVVRATVSRRMGRVHPMVTIVGALVGVGVAGVAGLILGPVALAMFFVLLEIYEKEPAG
ncbi:MAG TPA: AI-2E family transporter [Gemmatimonadaceae bacterium]|nr:AI-2E family transporter [Gemmatimonadaceae bacterium]